MRGVSSSCDMVYCLAQKGTSLRETVSCVFSRGKQGASSLFFEQRNLMFQVPFRTTCISRLRQIEDCVFCCRLWFSSFGWACQLVVAFGDPLVDRIVGWVFCCDLRDPCMLVVMCIPTCKKKYLRFYFSGRGISSSSSL